MEVVRFLDLSVKNTFERNAFKKSLERMMNDGIIVIGDQVAEFEKEIAKACNRQYGIGVGSGTTALYLALKALKIPKGKEIITTPLSWVSSANAIVLNNLIPVFVDIDEYLNLDANLIEEKITKNTAGILSVDFGGQMCDYEKLNEICNSNNIALIEDSSQAMGAKSTSGPAGSQGLLSATSHNPMKSLAALGEAGSVTTNSQTLCEKLKTLRYSGTENKTNCIEPSINGRLDTFQADILNIRIKNLQEIIKKRNDHADFFDKNLHKAIARPRRAPYTEIHGFYTYQIRTKKRNELMRKLSVLGIETKIQHNPLISDQTYYKSAVNSKPMPNAFNHAQESLCLPIHEKLSQVELTRVVEAVKACSNELGL